MDSDIGRTLSEIDKGTTEPSQLESDTSVHLVRLELKIERQQKDIDKLSDLLRSAEIKIGLLQKEVEDAKTSREDISDNEFLSSHPSPAEEYTIERNKAFFEGKKKRFKKMLYISFFFLVVYFLLSLFWDTLISLNHKTLVDEIQKGASAVQNINSSHAKPLSAHASSELPPNKKQHRFDIDMSATHTKQP